MSTSAAAVGSKPMTLKERLLQYQASVRRKREYAKRQKLQVNQLDSAKTNVSEFASAESLKNRKPTTVSADMVNALADNMWFEFDQDTDNSSMDYRGDEGSESLSVSGSSEQLEGEEVDEEEIKEDLLRVLSGPDGEEKEELKPEEKPYKSIRVRYLDAIKDLTPAEGRIKELNRQERLAVLRGDSHKRERFLGVRSAWDKYDNTASDRPYERTNEDKEVDEKIKTTESNVATQWSDLANQVIDDILDDDVTEAGDEEDDDELFELVDNARRMKHDNDRRQRKKDKATVRRETAYLEEKLKAEDSELLEEALRLREQHRMVKRTGLRASLVARAADAERYSEMFGDNSDAERSVEWENRWKEEARRQRLEANDKRRRDARIKNTTPGPDESSEEDAAIIEQGKKLRRAYIRQLANEREDSDSDSDDDEDVDNIAKWVREARELRSVSQAMEKRKSLSMTPSLDRQTVAATSKLVSDSDDSSSSSDSSDSDIDKETKYLWREEARQLQEAARAKKAEEDEATAEAQTPKESKRELDEVVKKAMELERRYQERKTHHKADKDSDSDSDDDDDDRAKWIQEARALKGNQKLKLSPEKEAWLEEAKKLRQDAIAAKKKQGVGSTSSSDDDSSDDEEVLLRAMKRKQAAEKVSGAPAASTPAARTKLLQQARADQKAKKKGGEQNGWLAQTEKLKAATQGVSLEDAKAEAEAVVADAKKLRKEYIRERLKYGYGSESEEEEDDIDDLARWVEVARVAREKKLKKTKGKSDQKPATSAPLAPSSRAVAQTAKKKASSDSDSDSDDSSSSEDETWREEARRLQSAARAARLASSTDDSSSPESEGDYADVIKKAKQLEQRYQQKKAKKQGSYRDSDSDDSDGEEPDRSRFIQEARALKGKEKLKLSSEKEKWLEEAKKLRQEAIAAKKKQGVGSTGSSLNDSDDDSSDDEEVMLKAMRRKKAAEKVSGAAAASLPESRAKFIQEARNERTSRKKGTHGDAWMAQVRRLRAEAEEELNAARQHGAKVPQLSKDEVQAEAEAVVSEAKKMRKEYIRERLKYGYGSESDKEEDDIDDLARWGEAAKRARMRKQKMKVKAQDKSPFHGVPSRHHSSDLRKTAVSESDSDSDSDSSSDESSSSSDHDDWKDEARRLHRAARANKAGDSSDSKLDNESDEEFSNVVRKAKQLQQRYQKKKAKKQGSYSDSDSDDSDGKEPDRSRFIQEARALKGKEKLKLSSEKEKWLKEAKKMRQDELAVKKKRGVGSTGSSLNDSDDDSSDDEEVMLKAMRRKKVAEKLSGAAAASTPAARTKFLQEARSDTKARKKGHSGSWMEQARRLRAEVEEELNAARQYGAKVPSASQEDVQAETKAVVADAKKLRKEYIRERLKYGYGSESDEEDDDIDDLARWVDAARVAREKRRKQRKQHKTNSSSAHTPESDTDDSEESDEEIWREEGRRFKESRAQGRKGRPGLTDDSKPDNDMDGVVEKAMELKRRFRKSKSMRSLFANESGSEDEGIDRSTWIKEAASLKSNEKLTLHPDREAWLTETKKLRREAKGAGKKVDNIEPMSDEESEDDEELLLKAMKLKKVSEKNTSSEGARSKFIQEAISQQKSKRKSFAGNAWMNQARRLKEEALEMLKAARGNEQAVSKSVEATVSSDVDNIVESAKQLRREYIRERVKYGYSSDSDEADDDIDDMSRWIEAAKKKEKRASTGRRGSVRRQSITTKSKDKRKKDQKEVKKEKKEKRDKKEKKEKRDKKEKKEKKEKEKSSKPRKDPKEESQSVDQSGKVNVNMSAMKAGTSNWIKEARRRKEEGLNALKAARDEVRRRREGVHMSPPSRVPMSAADNESRLPSIPVSPAKDSKPKARDSSRGHRRESIYKSKKASKDEADKGASTGKAETRKHSKKERRGRKEQGSYGDTSLGESSESSDTVATTEVELTARPPPGKQILKRSYTVNSSSDEEAVPGYSLAKLISSPTKRRPLKSQKSDSDISDPSESETVRSDADDDVAHLFGGKEMPVKKERATRRASAMKIVDSSKETPKTPTGASKKKLASPLKKTTKSPSKKSSKKREEDATSPRDAKKSTKTPMKSPFKTRKSAKASDDKFRSSKKGNLGPIPSLDLTDSDKDVPSDAQNAVGGSKNSFPPSLKNSDDFRVKSDEATPSSATTAKGATTTSTPAQRSQNVSTSATAESSEKAEPQSGVAKTARRASQAWINPLTDWINEPAMPIRISGPQIQMVVPAFSSCWRLTRGMGIDDTAPFYFQKVSGDFELLCKVSSDMNHRSDRAGIMVRIDEANWILSGLEYMNGRVYNSTCVTLNSTDRSITPLPLDAEKSGVWFCAKRLGATFECFYSLDLRSWIQTRQGLLSKQESVSVGICGACPEGAGFRAKFTYFKCRPTQAPPQARRRSSVQHTK